MPTPEWNQDSLVWRFAMTDDEPDLHDTPEYAVTIGWRGPGVGGFNICHGVSVDAPTRWPRSGSSTGAEGADDNWRLSGKEVLVLAC